MYVINAVEKAGCFSHITLVSQSDKIIENCDREGVKTIKKFPGIKGDSFIISGRAPCVSAATIKKAVFEYDGRQMVFACGGNDYYFDNETISSYVGVCDKVFNAFYILAGRPSENSKVSFKNGGQHSIYDKNKVDLKNDFSDDLDVKVENNGWSKSVFGRSGGVENKENIMLFRVQDKETVVINSVNEFELALVLKKKQQNRDIIAFMVQKRIEEKKRILSALSTEKSICLIGHSQFDQWNIPEIAGYKVRNCSISGISSFEYNDFILIPNALDCHADLFLIMHGTNDIVWDYTIDEMVLSIKKI